MKTVKKFPSSLADLEAGFHGMENSMVKTRAGNARIEMGEDMMPKPPQTPAQHRSVVKAAQASALKRKGFALPAMPGKGKL